MNHFRQILSRTTHNEEETEGLTEEIFLEILRPLKESLLLLEGDLGAGKTTFTRGFARPMGITDTINSPTFNLLNRYDGSRGILFHYDLYRISGPDEFLDLGFSELWSSGASESELPVVHAIEWWQRIEDLFPFPIPTFKIRLAYNPDQEEPPRQVELYAYEKE